MKLEEELFLLMYGIKKGMVFPFKEHSSPSKNTENLIKDLEELAEKSKIHIEKSVYAFKLDDGTNLGFIWDYNFSFLFDKFVMLFDLPESIDRVRYDIMVGLGLGYPLCCIFRYLLDKNTEGSEKSLKRYLKQTEKHGSDPFKMGINKRNIPQDYDSPYISHIPCLPTCRKSLKIKEISRKWLKKAKGFNVK